MENTSDQFLNIGFNPASRITIAEVEKIPLSLPCLMGWKDRTSGYLGISDYLINFSGLDSRDKVLGKTDRDIERFLPHADFYMTCDQFAMTVKPYHGVEKIMTANNEPISIQAAKHPIYDNSRDKVVGVLFLGVLAEEYQPRLPACLAENNSNASIFFSGSQYVFEFGKKTIELSEKESSVLYFYLRGRTAKEIATCLFLSVRTVEGYISEIKMKLDCPTRSSIVDFVMMSGLFKFIPMSIARAC